MKDPSSKKDENSYVCSGVPSSSSLRSCSSSYFIFLLPLTFAIIFSTETCFWVSHFLKTKTKQSIMLFLEFTSLYLMPSIATILKTTVYIGCLHHLTPYSLLFGFFLTSYLTFHWDHYGLCVVKPRGSLHTMYFDTLLTCYIISCLWNVILSWFSWHYPTWFCSYLLGYFFQKYFLPNTVYIWHNCLSFHCILLTLCTFPRVSYWLRRR